MKYGELEKNLKARNKKAAAEWGGELRKQRHKERYSNGYAVLCCFLVVCWALSIALAKSNAPMKL